MSATDDTNAKSMTIIVTKGTLDWTYPPMTLATTAAAMDVNVSMEQPLKSDISLFI